ncbi:LysR family transcriptional regulator [Amnibacterium sp.]|uniref:LysR family transcriptional regulator n=1 Tax=Amnibacterium sp. TaxID=1872496 RepID=UPI003F7BE391
MATPSIDALRALVEVARTGSIAAAARALGVTQQAVSARIRTAERDIGTPVLLRTATGSTLTEPGALLADWARDVLDAMDRLDVGVRTLAHERPSRLRIAASQTVAESLLPRWLVALRREEERTGAPVTVAELVTENSTGVVDRVRRGDAELGFIETPQLPDGLRLDRIGTDELVLVVAPGHAWARRDEPVTLGELAATPLVVRERGSGTREALDRLLEAEPAAVAAPVTELGTTAAVRSAVAAGIAPAVLSRLVVRDDLVLGRLVAVPIAGEPLRRPLTAVRRREGPSRAAARLVRIASAEREGPGQARPRAG